MKHGDRGTDHPLASVGGVAGIVIGIVIARYCGLYGWFPAIVLVAVGLLFGKTSIRPAHYRAAIAGAIAHACWFAFAAFAAHGLRLVGLDLLVLIVAIVWMWRRPGRGALLFLGGYEALSLFANLFAMSAATLGTAPHRALVAHVMLRLFVLGSLYAAHRSLNAVSDDEDASDPVTVAT